jgi:hypothetical protein
MIINSIMPVQTTQLIQDARGELKDAVVNRERLDRRIAELRILLRTLARFMPEEAHRQALLREVANAKRRLPSLPEAVLDLLMRNVNGMTSNQIRESLEQSGFDLEEYSQPLAAIMTVLSRLVAAGTAKRRVGRDKTVVFRMADFDKTGEMKSLADLK